LSKAFNKVARWAFDNKKTSITPDDLDNRHVQGLVSEMNNVLKEAVLSGIDYQIPAVMHKKLADDVFVFSGAKTYAELRELSNLLIDGEGGIKSFSTFFKDVRQIHNQYNKAYLESEYLFATQSAQMASKWADFEQDGDRYNLQYRTANDDRVRHEHQALHDITLPPSDPFWSKYYPPNGWRCRCNVVQVRKERYDVTDSATASDLGAKATYTVGAGGKNTSEMFRFNPGKQNTIFPPNHPYFSNKELMNKLSGQDKSDKALINLKDFIKGDEPTNNEVKNILTKFAELSPDDFRQGLDKVGFAKSNSYLMQHSMSYRPATGEWIRGSTITISTFDHKIKIDGKFETLNPANELKGALGAIKKGQKLTFKQEYTVESLWHEILHAKTKTKPFNLTITGVREMETVNQFVARHTYDNFLKSLGGTARYKGKILDEGIGYQQHVADFRKLLKDNGIDEKKAVNALMPKLMSDYSTIGYETDKFIYENKKKD
jgi:SPP1 gp7 family putative phage head morphogenesis protein